MIPILWVFYAVVYLLMGHGAVTLYRHEINWRNFLIVLLWPIPMLFIGIVTLFED
jgi:hypothetical protein